MLFRDAALFVLLSAGAGAAAVDGGRAAAAAGRADEAEERAVVLDGRTGARCLCGVELASARPRVRVPELPLEVLELIRRELAAVVAPETEAEADAATRCNLPLVALDGKLVGLALGWQRQLRRQLGHRRPRRRHLLLGPLLLLLCEVLLQGLHLQP